LIEVLHPSGCIKDALLNIAQSPQVEIEERKKNAAFMRIEGLTCSASWIRIKQMML